MAGDDIQPLPPDAKAGGEAGNEADPKDETNGQGKAKDAPKEEPEEMSFFEKLALKAAKFTGSVPMEAVFQEKVRSTCQNLPQRLDFFLFLFLLVLFIVFYRVPGCRRNEHQRLGRCSLVVDSP